MRNFNIFLTALVFALGCVFTVNFYALAGEVNDLLGHFPIDVVSIVTLCSVIFTGMSTSTSLHIRSNKPEYFAGYLIILVLAAVSCFFPETNHMFKNHMWPSYVFWSWLFLVISNTSLSGYIFFKKN